MLDDEKATFTRTSSLDYDIDTFLLEKDPPKLRSTKLRWLALALACFNCFGSSFCYDLPQPLQDMLIKDLRISTIKYDLLYSVYSMPNIILPFFGGIIIDRLGLGKTITIFSCFVALGQLLSTIGVFFNIFSLLIAGRILLGIGGESLGVAQSVVISKWFLEKELAFALGASISIIRSSSALNSVLSPRIYFRFGKHLYMPFLFGTFLCGASWLAGVFLVNLDRKADFEEGSTKSVEEPAHFRCQDLKKFKRIFYLLLFACACLYGASAGLMNNLNDLMVHRFSFTPETAGDCIPIVYICALIMTPILGFYSDRKGKRVIIILFSCAILFATHLTMALLRHKRSGELTLGLALGLLGLGLSNAAFAAAYWPCLPLVVNDKMIGTAYGMSSAAYNLMLAIIPLVVGTIHEKTIHKKDGYYWTEILLAMVTVLGAAFSLCIYIEDSRTGGKLERPTNERDRKSLLIGRIRLTSFGRG